MNIKEMVERNVKNKMTVRQAEYYAAQEIILTTIANSTFKEKVLLKGGAVMFNLTKNIRRSTSDLDFDFFHYDISKNSSIELFVKFLNENCKNYEIKIQGKIQELKQEDYKGKRVHLIISDSSYQINFKLDIGVHTYMFIPQKEVCFSFDDENECILKVNPPEQMVIEKLHSLLKHGIVSTRYKDILDIYYLIDNHKLNNKLMLDCIKNLEKISAKEIAIKIDDILNNENYRTRFLTAEKWLDIEYKNLVNKIVIYFKKLN